MRFTPLSKPRTRLADQVYDQIVEAIRDGSISPDRKVVQEKLAEQFQISRTPVREALIRMEQEGILAFAGRGGFVIRQLTQDEVAEIYESRAAIEGHAARLLARRNDPALNQRLREAIEAEESIHAESETGEGAQLTQDSIKAYFHANRRIHRSIVEATGNRFLLEFFDKIWNRSTSFLLFASIETADIPRSLGDHLALIDAIALGDGAAANQKMIDHIHDGFHLQIETAPA